MKRVSAFAAQHLGPGDFDDEAARENTSRASPMLEWVIAQQDKARERARINARSAWAWLARMIAAFIVSICPVPHWLGVTMFWVTVACGLVTLERWRAFRVARIQASLWPE